MKPITPDEVTVKKRAELPDEVLETFNELIAKGCTPEGSTVYQEDVVELMIDKGLNEQKIYSEHWLDVEQIYRDAGWLVEYDKPGFNEDYRAYYTFVNPKYARTV